MIGRINEFKIIQKINASKLSASKYKDNTFYKTIGFVYERIMNFGSRENIKQAVISENFFSNFNSLIHGKHAIHHSHIIGVVVEYAHIFCRLKVRESKNQISSQPFWF